MPRGPVRARGAMEAGELRKLAAELVAAVVAAGASPQQLGAVAFAAVRAAAGGPCPATCTCAESRCSDEVSACLADQACRKGQGGVDACPCGASNCLAGCALKDPSTSALPVLKCVMDNCGSEESVAVAQATLDCTCEACPAT